jgi:hypothetical protein
MSLTSISSSLKASLQAITLLKGVFSLTELPDKIDEEPAAIILAGETAEYSASYSGGSEHTIRILLLASRLDNPSSLTRLVPMMEESGENSIPAILLADSKVKTVSNSGMGATVWGGITYLSTEFRIQIMD